MNSFHSDMPLRNQRHVTSDIIGHVTINFFDKGAVTMSKAHS